MSLNLSSVLEHSARLVPHRIAITCGTQQITYAELDARATRVAEGLASIGISPGDRVLLSCPNVAWFPIAYFGILKAGAIVVPINVLLKPREIAYHLRDSGARAMVAFEGTAELPIAAMARAACDEAGCESLIVMPLDPARPPTVPAMSMLALMEHDAGTFVPPPREINDTAVILYTSGTTGQPKGAELTNANMVTNAIVSFDMFAPALEPANMQSAALITLPLFHSTAQTCQMNAGLYGGMRLILHPRFHPTAVLDSFARDRIAVWIAVPTMYWAVLEHARSTAEDLSATASSLRVCVSGGAPMPLEVLRGFEAAFKVRILEGYGLSETAPVLSFNQLHRPSKPGTVGLPIFGVEIRCVDEQDHPMPRGTRGEVVARGPNVMKGYYGRPAETAEALRGGWFHTGDIGVIDDDGYLAIVDRKKDMILRGGFNVYPREIEEVLMAHPGVALCAVVGVPDERLGEEIKAVVVRRPATAVTEAELIAWAREQVAAYKYPRQVEFRDSLPTNATGKILKRELRSG
jgi:long-chain acyl-CoA synthetase